MGRIHFKVRFILLSFLQIYVPLQYGKRIFQFAGYLLIYIVNCFCINFEFLKLFVYQLFALQEVFFHHFISLNIIDDSNF